MPSLRVFRIKFDRPDATYAPGDVVTGNLYLELERPKKIRGIRISAKGIAKTHWTESTRDLHDSDRTVTEHYDGSEEYFHSTYNVLVPTDGDTEMELPVGQSLHPFSFLLPERIPCSFEHHYGYIRYTVKAVIDRPWKFDHECKQAFTVVTALDLNAHLPQCVGVSDEFEKNFTCFCCFNVGQIEVTISFSPAGYVPGQTIYAAVAYVNHSSKVEVTKICVALAQRLKFRSTSPADTKTSNLDIRKASDNGPFQKRQYHGIPLQIPAIPPSRLEYCGLIDLNYTLDVSIHVSGWHCSIQKSYPILIGTIPLPPAQQTPPPYEVKPMVPLSPLMDDPGPPMPVPSAPYPEENPDNSQPPLPIGFDITNNPNIGWDIPPPSYEECMTRADSIKDKDDSKYVYGASQSFAPRYPVFNFPQAPQK